MEKLVTNLFDKDEYVVHIRNLKQALNLDWFWKTFIEWLNLIKKIGQNPISIWILNEDKKQKIILRKIF